MIIDELVSFSNLYGSNEELVLAGGGNTSAKDGNVMYVKGSGTALATITADGFVAMDRSKLAEIFTKSYPDNDKEREAAALADLMAARLPSESAKRPSVETTLHSIFEQRFVLHLHPALINGLTCGKSGQEDALRLLGEKHIFIEICKPGYVLAKLCFDKMVEYKARFGEAADTVILQNHGIFIADDTVDGLGEKLDKIMSALHAAVLREPDFASGAFDPEKAERCFNKIRSIYGEDAVVTFEPSAEAIALAENAETAAVMLKPFTPDHIVYCKAHPIAVHCDGCIAGTVNEYEDEHGYRPKIIMVNGCGFFAVDTSVKGSETAAMLFNDAIKIAVYSESFGGALHMTDELTDFIVNWEVEAYRAKANK